MTKYMCKLCGHVMPRNAHVVDISIHLAAVNRLNKTIFLVLIIIMAIVASTFAAVEFTQQQKVFADPWSWGGHPSKNWLHCYYSGSSDCSDVR